MDDMGTFRIDIELENPAVRGPRRRVEQLLVDTGSELTLVPAPELEALGVARERVKRFRQASGSVVERATGTVWIHASDAFTPDEVVFGEPNDLRILGSRTLEGLNVTIDPVSKKLVDAGPAPAAAA
ncbi:MAG: Retroviral aspartyl protease [Gemmatimonadetes bacterium]|nr:Retroviral aspartyl protease [Gemmatimonadota bacterium]